MIDPWIPHKERYNIEGILICYTHSTFKWPIVILRYSSAFWCKDYIGCNHELLSWCQVGRRWVWCSVQRHNTWKHRCCQTTISCELHVYYACLFVTYNCTALHFIAAYITTLCCNLYIKDYINTNFCVFRQLAFRLCNNYAMACYYVC